MSTVPIRLGFDSYSVRAFQWKAIQLLDYAAGLKLDTIQLSGLEDYESFEPAYLARVKDHAAKVGIAIDGGMGCICPLSASWNAKQGDPKENILRGLRVAKAVGATSMRCFMGSGADRRGTQPLEALMESTVALFRSVRSEAWIWAFGSRSRTMPETCRHTRSGRLSKRRQGRGGFVPGHGESVVGGGRSAGVARSAGAIRGDIARAGLGGVRATARAPRRNGRPWATESSIFHKFIERYRELCPQGRPCSLEIITGRPPTVLPYLEPDFWKAFPKAKASEFARFVALAKSGPSIQGLHGGGRRRQGSAGGIQGSLAGAAAGGSGAEFGVCEEIAGSGSEVAELGIP